MKKNISKIALFSVSMLLICAVGIVYAAGYDPSDLNGADGLPDINTPVKVTKLPGSDDTPKDVDGYILDVSDLNAADDPPSINTPVKVTKLPGPDDTPEDVGGYVLDVSDIDIEEIRALPCDLESIRMERIITEGPVTLNTENNRVFD